MGYRTTGHWPRCSYEQVFNNKEKQILEWHYGIDCKKKSQKFVADYFNTSIPSIKMAKLRALKKLNNEEVKKIIQIYYDF